MNIKLINAKRRPTILGWIALMPILPILIPYGIAVQFKLDKWKNDYEEFEFAKRLIKSECFDKLNDDDCFIVAEIELRHMDGYLKWKKVLNQPNRLYLGLYRAAKATNII